MKEKTCCKMINKIFKFFVLVLILGGFFILASITYENYKREYEYENAKHKYDNFIGKRFILDDEVRTIVDYSPCSETFILDNGQRIVANTYYLTLHYEFIE